MLKQYVEKKYEDARFLIQLISTVQSTLGPRTSY